MKARKLSFSILDVALTLLTLSVHSADVANENGPEKTTPEKQAVGHFWSTYMDLFSAPVNTKEGVTDISNKLEIAITPALDARFRDFGIEVITALRYVAANVKSGDTMQQIVNGVIALGVGQVPTVDLKGTERQLAAFNKSIANIQGAAIKLRLIAEKDFSINFHKPILFSWSWMPGFFNSDYSITNRNSIAWTDVAIRFAYYSPHDNTEYCSPTFTYKSVNAGQTLTFEDLFTSRYDKNAILSILIKSDDEISVMTWRCKIPNNINLAGLTSGTTEYYWEHLPGQCYKSTRFISSDEYTLWAKQSNSHRQIEISNDPRADSQSFRAEATKHDLEAKAAYPAFRVAYETYVDWKRENDSKDQGKIPTRDVMEPLEKAFDAWIIADKRYVMSTFKEIESSKRDDPSRYPVALNAIEHCNKRINDEVIQEFPVILSWYCCMKGRFHLTMGDEEAAEATWKSVLEISDESLPDNLKTQLKVIRTQIISDKIRTKLESGKYSEVISIFDGLSESNYFKSILETDDGRTLFVYYIKALMLSAHTKTDFEKPVALLIEAKNKNGIGGTHWLRDYAWLMREVIENACKKNIKVSGDNAQD